MKDAIIVNVEKLSVTLPEKLVAEVKAIASHQGWSTDYLIEQLLCNYLGEKSYICWEALEIARDQMRNSCSQSEQSLNNEELDG